MVKTYGRTRPAALLDDIAIVGYAFKLPQNIHDDSSFWEVLEKRRNMRSDWPESRLNAASFSNDNNHKSDFQRQGGYFLSEDPGAFDAPFFSVTAKEAAAMDPMQRWTLETSYHAFENAGMPSETLKGSQTAVFSASMLEDYARMAAMDPDNTERTAVTGSTVACVVPNRVSWYFDLRGPSIHVNTACSSALSAVDMACKSLQAGDASCALVTGANLLLDPGVFQVLSSGGFLSPDGRCYSFDERANGYARGEGFLALVLKPVTAAVRDGDMIRAVIRSIGSNQDGHTPVLTQPSAESQELLIRHVYQRAGLPFDQTRYVEAHGTGTKVGDPIETRAIGRVFGNCRSLEEPLFVGSIKANMGHLEGASALASIIKAILILEKGVIPGQALLEKVNPDIDVDSYHLAFPTETTPWPSSGLRRVSVNSFGFGGSNSHIILDDAMSYLQQRGLHGNHHCTISDLDGGSGRGDGASTPVDAKLSSSSSSSGNSSSTSSSPRTSHTPRTVAADDDDDEISTVLQLPKLLVWSAADEAALKRMTQAYMSYSYNDSYYEDDRVTGRVAFGHSKLARLAHTLSERRSRMLWRSFSVAMDGAETEGHQQQQQQLTSSKPVRSSAEVGLGFVFTGQGAQYATMGSDLCRYPVFYATLRQVDRVYRSLGAPWSSVSDALRSPENIDKPEYSQPLTTAVQVALVDLLKSFDVTPKAVVGHSSGEIAAAYAVGALSLESACRVAFFRGQLAGKLRNSSISNDNTNTNASSSTPGAMLSVNLAEDQVADYLSKIFDVPDAIAIKSVCVACVNSPLNCTLSGPEAAIDAVKAQADRDSIFAQKLRTGVAYHSPSMLAIADEYLLLMKKKGLEGDAAALAASAETATAATTIPMVSSVTGKVAKAAELIQPEYWVRNMVSPVRFANAVRLLVSSSSFEHVTDLIEVGPHPALRRPVQDSISAERQQQQIRYASVLHRSRPAPETLVELMGQLFCSGHGVSVSAVNRGGKEEEHAEEEEESKLPEPPLLLDCPSYPFDHSHRYWAESRLSRDFRLRGAVQGGDCLGVRVSDWNPLAPRWRNFLSVESTPWIGHHKISDTVLYPAAGMLMMAIEAVQQQLADVDDRTVLGYQFERADFLHPILVPNTWEERTETQVHLQPLAAGKEEQQQQHSFDVAIFSYARSGSSGSSSSSNSSSSSIGQWSECFHGRVTVEYTDGDKQMADDEGVRELMTRAETGCKLPVDSQVFYHDAAEQGLQYGDWFQLLRDIRWDGDKTAVAHLDVSRERYQTGSLVHPALLDTAFHVLRASAGQQAAANVPVRLEKAWFAAAGWQQQKRPNNSGASAVTPVRWLATSNGSTKTNAGEQGTLYALATDGTVLCAIGKAVTKAVTAAVSKNAAESSAEIKNSNNKKKLLYGIEWKPQLSLLEPQQLARICSANVQPRDETTVVANHAKLCAALDLVAVRTLQRIDRSKIPANHLARHVDWMEHHTTTLTPARRQEGKTITDADLEARLLEVDAALPAWRLYTACARQLGSILAGDVDPLQVVFESDLAQAFYADLFLNLCADGRLTNFLDLASHENPAMRILEVGAGTGGMTGHVLKALQAREVRTGAPSFAQYMYTDISPVFFERARSRWPDLVEHGRMTFKTLDLGRSVESQGFEAGSYDMVIAASVLHATPYIEDTLRNVRATLKPGGRLVLVEVVNPADIATNFMAGLVPGWWVAREEWRPHSAAVSEPMWDKLLRANGFSGNDVLLRDYRSEECHIMSVLVSTAVSTTTDLSAAAAAAAPPPPPPELEPKPEQDRSPRIVIVVDEGASDQQLQVASAVGSLVGRPGPDSKQQQQPKPTISSIAADELSDALVGLTEDDAVICIAEVCGRPLLAGLSDRHYASLQLLVKHSPRLLWVTAPTSRDDPLAAHYSAAQGFLRSVRAEQEQERIRFVNLTIEIEDGSGSDSTAHADIIAKTFQVSFAPSLSGRPSSSKEVEYVLRNGVLMTGRAVENVDGNQALQSLLQPQPRKVAWADTSAMQLSARSPDNAGNDAPGVGHLSFVQDLSHSSNSDIAPDEVEIEAKAWSLGQGDEQVSGSGPTTTSCAGIITRVGSNCSPSSLLQPGDHVCVVLPLGSFHMSKYLRAHHTAVARVPPRDKASFEAATASLVPGLTAYHALVNVAHLQPGMSILIHHAAAEGEGVAQMAVQIAKRHGVDRIFATFSSPDEKKLLLAKKLGIQPEHIFPRRPAAAFARGVMRLTQGAGVSVVFNCALLGEDALLASCECLAPGGRFVEVGNRGNIAAGTALPMSVFAKNISFSAVQLGRGDLHGEVVGRLTKTMVQLLGEGSIQPLQPGHVVDVSRINEALRPIQGSSGAAEAASGPVVVRARDQDVISYLEKQERHWTFDEKASYFIAGGSGGLSREIIRWMADRGAKHIVMASRSGGTSDAAQELVAELRARHVNVLAAQCDVASESSLAGVLEQCARSDMPPIKGCINAAMVLQDAIFQDSMTYAQWDLGVRTKVQTSYNLHRLLPQNLDFFLLLSSLAGVVGQMASANYAAGCSFQDALARHRLARGQRALSLDIGWMKNIGIIAETEAYQRQRQRADDMQPIDASELLGLLTLCLDPTSPLPAPAHGQPEQVLFGLRTPADLVARGRAVPALLGRPLFAAFSYDPAAAKTTRTGQQPSSSGAASVVVNDSALFREAAVGSRERAQVVRRALAKKLARAMSIAPEDVEPSKPLSAYGVDSLMAVELRNWFAKEFGANVAVFDIMGRVSIAKIADLVSARSSFK